MIRRLCLWTVFGSVACAPPDVSEMFEDAVVRVAVESDTTEQAFVDAISSASRSLHVALPDAHNPAITDALLDVWGRLGGDPDFIFEVIVDYDDRADTGIAALIADDAPVTLADDGLSYFEFTLNDDVTWTSDQTIMSHAYVVVDSERVVTATTAGHERTGPRILLELRGENLIEDLLTEHNQIFGGTDATSVTAFDSPAKSIADSRWRYETTGDVDLEMWFGPQERTTKRVIDAVYSARSAIWVVTDDLANDGLAAALKEKARWGFDVRVVVGPAFRSNSRSLSEQLLVQRGDLQVVQVPDVDQLPSLVLIDLPVDDEGFAPHARAMILTHDLVSSARLYRTRPVVTDQLIDGALWVLSDTTPDRAELLELETLFQDLFDGGVAP